MANANLTRPVMSPPDDKSVGPKDTDAAKPVVNEVVNERRIVGKYTREIAGQEVVVENL